MEARESNEAAVRLSRTAVAALILSIINAGIVLSPGILLVAAGDAVMQSNLFEQVFFMATRSIAILTPLTILCAVIAFIVVWSSSGRVKGCKHALSALWITIVADSVSVTLFFRAVARH